MQVHLIFLLFLFVMNICPLLIQLDAESNNNNNLGVGNEKDIFIRLKSLLSNDKCFKNMITGLYNIYYDKLIKYLDNINQFKCVKIRA